MVVMSVKDIQKKLNIGRDKAYALMHSSGFPSTKLGGQYIVTEEALEKWLRSYEYKTYAM